MRIKHSCTILTKRHVFLSVEFRNLQNVPSRSLVSGATAKCSATEESPKQFIREELNRSFGYRTQVRGDTISNREYPQPRSSVLSNSADQSRPQSRESTTKVDLYLQLKLLLHSFNMLRHVNWRHG